jgi:uncharacterized protein (TIGR00251 family)
MIRITAQEGGAAFSVKVVPRASRNEIAGVQGEAIRVRLTAPPIEGAANRALVKLLAETLKVPEHDVEIVTGHAGRQKVVRVAGLSAHELGARLREHLSAI